MKIKTLSKALRVVLSGLALLLFAFGILFFYVYATGVSSVVKSSSSVDVILFSNNASSNSNRSRNTSPNIFISRYEINQNKHFNSLVPISQNYTLYPFGSAETTATSTDSKLTGVQGFENLNFMLNGVVSENTLVQIQYDSTQKTLHFVLPNSQMNINGKNYSTKERILYSLENIPPDLIIQIGEANFQNISNDFIAQATIGSFKNKEIKIFRLVSKNLLDPGIASFESGLWQQEAGDCSNQLAGEPNFRLSASKDASQGKTSANIFSANHYACISKTFPIEMKSDKLYQFLFDYKNVIGNDVQYYFKLRGENYTDQEGYAAAELLRAQNHEWNTSSVIINPEIIRKNFITPEYSKTQADKRGDLENLGNEGVNDLLLGDPLKDIQYMNVFFYATSDGTKEISNLYDNVRLKEYELAETRKIEIDPIIGEDATLAENISLQSGENAFEYVVDTKNMLDPGIASFENGLWQQEAGDCSNTQPGEPNFTLEKSADASDGSMAMKVSSKNHYACIPKTFPISVTNGILYKLQFDYKNLMGNTASYYYNLRSDEKQNAHQETIETKDSNWHTHESIIDPGISGIKYVDIFFYAPSDGTKEVSNLYDNVRLTEWLPRDLSSYYLYATHTIDESISLKSVEYKAINRWKNKVILYGATKSFLLVYPEKYSENWKAYPMQTVRHNVGLGVLERYSVPEVESNRQADKGEIQQMINDGLISAPGLKFISKNFDGSIRNDNLSADWFWETWFKTPIPENIHFKVNDYGNSWWIDVDELCKQRKFCTQNADGSYDIEMVIEFWPQRWFYLGLLISGTTLLACLGYLGYEGIRRIRRKYYAYES